MKPTHLLLLPAVATCATAQEQTTVLEIEIPRLDVAEYHRPYLAAWIENAANEHKLDLAVRYDTELRNNEGETWLKDIRQWWRRSGRSLDLPIDGLSQPTMPPGKHQIDVTSLMANLPALADGEYTLLVEAAREVGGREVVKVPFRWDGKSVSRVEGKGESELGVIVFENRAAEPKPAATAEPQAPAAEAEQPGS